MNSCESIREHIDGYIDGELGRRDCEALEAHCASCAACARELAVARRVREELRALPVFTAPARTIAAAESRINASRVMRLPARRPNHRVRAVLVAAVAVIVAASVWLGMRSRTPSTPEYSQAEIRQATGELALAFGYVDRYSAQAAEIIHDDVLEQRVAPQIERALNTSREAVIDDAIVPGIRRAVRDSGLNVTSPPPGRS